MTPKALDFYAAVDFSKRSVDVLNQVLSRFPLLVNGLLINGYYYTHVNSYRENALEVLKRHELKIIIDPGTYSVWRKNQQKPFSDFLPILIENIAWTHQHLIKNCPDRIIFGILLPDHHMNPYDTIQLASQSYSILTGTCKISKDKLIGVCHGSLPEIPTNKFVEEYVSQHLHGIVDCCRFYIQKLNLRKIGLGACSAFKIKADPLNLFQRRAEVLSEFTKTLGNRIHIHALGVGTKDLVNKIRDFIDSFDTQTYLTTTKVRKLHGQGRTEAAVKYILDLLSSSCQ